MTEPSAESAIIAAKAAHFARGAALRARLSGPVRIVLIGVVLALGLRSLVYEPYNIPSESMQPGLLVGDYLFVAKWPYGYSRNSLPLLLLPFDGRVFGAAPQRGDIVVFKSPADNRTDFIKRVIGLPGDRVRMVHGQVELNGILVPRQPLGAFTVDVDQCPTVVNCTMPRYAEQLPGGRRYTVLDEVPNDTHDDTDLQTVPPGHVFVLGDNRDDSADSRLALADGGVGMVPLENLLGRADRIFFSVSRDGGWRVRAGRIGLAL